MSSADQRQYVLIQALNEVSDANLVAGRCHIAARRRASGLRLTDFQAAATASCHVVIAAARSTR